MTLQVGVYLELCLAYMADERTVARVSAQVDDQLTRVATGVRTDLTPGGETHTLLQETQHDQWGGRYKQFAV